MTDSKDTAAKISIHDVCGTAPLTGTNGIRIHKLILSRWEPSKTVEVDFTNVLPSFTFLKEAIGELIGRFTKAEIVVKLKLTGLSAADKTILNGIVVNRYHSLANAEKAKNRPQTILKLKE
ncbi:MAG: STAS-like domain-containing protein [Elusimicrobiota bacterium]|nr:STAS-like domain-containing protein [Elusimicrobiota bacterium]